MIGSKRNKTLIERSPMNLKSLKTQFLNLILRLSRVMKKSKIPLRSTKHKLSSWKRRKLTIRALRKTLLTAFGKPKDK